MQIGGDDGGSADGGGEGGGVGVVGVVQGQRCQSRPHYHLAHVPEVCVMHGCRSNQFFSSIFKKDFSGDNWDLVGIEENITDCRIYRKI